MNIAERVEDNEGSGDDYCALDWTLAYWRIHRQSMSCRSIWLMSKSHVQCGELGFAACGALQVFNAATGSDDMKIKGEATNLHPFWCPSVARH